MTDEGSHSFSSFWKGAIDSVSSKTVKFMPNMTKVKSDKSTEEGDSSGLTQKQKRRAQVRKAQIGHRQRKQNYVKHLEQDVVNLRGMIATVETETITFKHENEAIRDQLWKAKVDVEIVEMPVQNLAQDFSHLMTYQPPSASESIISPEHKHEVQSEDTNANMMLVTADFDEILDAICLQVSPLDAIPAATSTDGLDTKFSQQTSRDALPAVPLQRLKTSDLETLGINFILALEHCCWDHLSVYAHTFDPEGSPSGHTLMASMILYDSAPPAAFDSLSTSAPPLPDTTAPSPTRPCTWQAPSSSLTLSSLLGLAQSLPKSDWEITPVQAWFKLVEYLGEERLMDGNGRILELLKPGLGKLMGCWYFGAVMNEVLFWDVVGSVCGVDGRVN